MLDITDPSTSYNIRSLVQCARQTGRPLALWVGAGTSSWCSYPRWEELGDIYHSAFARFEPLYDKKNALDLLKKGQYPEFFQHSRDVNSKLYYRLLSENFAPRETRAVYQRFVRAIKEIHPLYVITTNIDDLLERSLPSFSVIGRNDIERCAYLLNSGTRFVAKLHGSVSDVRSTVFTRTDYQELVNNTHTVSLLKAMLSRATVVFVGYGLSDDYVLAALSDNNRVCEIFGDGPHFAILPSPSQWLPDNVKVIRYLSDPHTDHRSAISVLEEVAICMVTTSVDLESGPRLCDKPQIRSAHLLSHMFPPGRWSSSQTLEISADDGTKRQVIVGTGFTDAELPGRRSTAMHDLVVGLLCFDVIVCPINEIANMHSLLGAEVFWRLVDEDIIQFVNVVQDECIIFPSADCVAEGSIASIVALNDDMSPRTAGEIIRKSMRPTFGKEDIAEQKFCDLESKINALGAAQEDKVPGYVRGLLLRPSVRKLVGISEGTPVSSIARWQAFPVLRLANVVKLGILCNTLGVGSVKLHFGTSALAGPAFAAVNGHEWTDDAASYVIYGSFSAELGSIAIADSGVLEAVFRFRDTQAGEQLRKEVLDNLSASAGAEVSVSVNNALRGAIPIRVLQAARDQFLKLLVRRQALPNPEPVLWQDTRYAESAILKWKIRSREMLDQYCKKYSIKPYDSCPCGSGEKLKFCCSAALHKNGL